VLDAAGFPRAALSDVPARGKVLMRLHKTLTFSRGKATTRSKRGITPASRVPKASHRSRTGNFVRKGTAPLKYGGNVIVVKNKQ
jgi:hypothetical protein